MKENQNFPHPHLPARAQCMHSTNWVVQRQSKLLPMASFLLLSWCFPHSCHGCLLWSSRWPHSPFHAALFLESRAHPPEVLSLSDPCREGLADLSLAVAAAVAAYLSGSLLVPAGDPAASLPVHRAERTCLSKHSPLEPCPAAASSHGTPLPHSFHTSTQALCRLGASSAVLAVEPNRVPVCLYLT